MTVSFCGALGMEYAKIKAAKMAETLLKVDWKEL
jgi:hypothetical protein